MGGWGGSRTRDGNNAIFSGFHGDTFNCPAEVAEARYGLFVEQLALNEAPGGEGQHRGGKGIVLDYRVRSNGCFFTCAYTRNKHRPWGLEGGLSGFGNSVAIDRFGAAEEQRFHNGKALNQVLHAGDAYILRSGGGGGFGSPLERDLESLAHDLRCGYVSKHAAETYYGAVFAPGTNTIDAAATAARRAEMQRQGLPHDEPIADTGVPPPASPHTHAHDHGHENLSEEERVALAMTGRCCS